MKFTQFTFPHGGRSAEFIDMADDVEALAAELTEAGWDFEIECHPERQTVNMDCCDIEKPIAARSCQNGPDVPVKVEELVREAHANWIERGKPRARTPLNAEG
ncbi:hypothetical protein LCGC14_0320360 [marine sediment metagenome]|uniref:Uncharacterized protein n=1 Tax=marine sediment metagenome TaxID=412755 RepID=A0A0F9WRP0_9ZZZZ